MFIHYVLKVHGTDLKNILLEPEQNRYFSVEIDFLKLFETHPDLGDKILCCPIQTLNTCDQNLIDAQKKIIEDSSANLGYSLKQNVRARFFGLPVCPELHRIQFPKNIDMGCFLKVSGTVVRMTQSKMLEYRKQFICAHCEYTNLVVGEYEQRYILRAPAKCGNPDTQCRSMTFNQVMQISKEDCKDYQEIKIQEQMNKLAMGSIPGSMWVTIEEDLVDACKPGDDVNICGIVRRRWRPGTANKRSEVELVFQANHIEVSNCQKTRTIAVAEDVKKCFEDFWQKFEKCPLRGRDVILSSICPQVYGLQLVKLALLLTVITGSNHSPEDEDQNLESHNASTARDTNKMNLRGQCHLLLVGDPGTGKSQLLRCGAVLTPRCVLTSGTGSTKAGLTCSALRENGEWQLEAGALVLSDGGVCCIDEIGQMREHDRASIHEAMEQQTISIAKAGIVCKLKTRCAVVAACNPKGHYDTDQPLSVNVSLGTPLLSRFDLIFILLDRKNEEWDKLVSSYILFGDVGDSHNKVKPCWNADKLQMYIAYVGPKPVEMTKSANMILQTYYMMQRMSSIRDPSRTTVRMLDSLVRLSQAHCKLMFRSTVLPMDAIAAIGLMDLSMQDCTLQETVTALHSIFPKYPDFQYLKTARSFFLKLNLTSLWDTELKYYSQLLNVDKSLIEMDLTNSHSKFFARFDNVSDDNVSIPLSSTLVTSSYFNINTKDASKSPPPKKKELKHNQSELIDRNKDKNVPSTHRNATSQSFLDESIDEKQLNDILHVEANSRSSVLKQNLTNTLNKYKKVNKSDKLPPLNCNDKKNNATMKKNKRKRNTVAGNSNKRRKLKDLKGELNETDDSDEINQNETLNALPSVNDIFNKLLRKINNYDPAMPIGNDATLGEKDCIRDYLKRKDKIQSDKLSIDTIEIKENEEIEEKDNAEIENTIKSDMVNEPKIRNNTIESSSVNNQELVSKTVFKLKQFQFQERKNKKSEVASRESDLNASTSKEVRLANVAEMKREQSDNSLHLGLNNCKTNSSTGSQISMFETSDCDIDIDL